jgi:hypothetical protein
MNDVNNDANNVVSNGAPQNKDQNVLSFMMQLVQERYGDDIEIEFLNQEADRLYNLFGNNLVSYFEPMLTDQQKMQFDQLAKQSTNQEALLGFLTQAIPDLEEKIMQVLIAFRNAYLTEGQQQQVQTPQVPQAPMAPQA